MKITMRKFGWFALTGIVSVLPAFSCSAQPPTPEELKNAKVETITVASVEQKLKEGKGKVVVINLWATWCPPCRAELPDLNAFYKEADKDQIAFLSLSVDDAEELEKTVRPFVAKQRLAFPVYVVKDPDLDELSKKLGVELDGAIPTTIVYNREGKPSKPWVGGISKKELEDLVKQNM